MPLSCVLVKRAVRGHYFTVPLITVLIGNCDVAALRKTWVFLLKNN